MIVSATTLSGQALASATGNVGGVVVECRNPNRHPPRPRLNSATRNHRDQPPILISQEPLNSWRHCASHNPALVIHMAARAFVRRSHAEPFEDVGFGIGEEHEVRIEIGKRP